MKLKKIIASIAAGAVALSAMAINAFAAINDYPDGFVVDLLADGYNIMEVYGFSVTIDSSSAGGGMGFNSPSTGWDSHEFGAGKEIEIKDNTITLTKSAPVFKETDATDPSNPYAQLWVQSWWGDDFSVVSYSVLGADGAVLSAGEMSAPPADEGDADAAGDENTDADAANDDADAADEADDADEAEDLDDSADVTDEDDTDDYDEDETDDYDDDADDSDDADDVDAADGNDAPAPADNGTSAAPATGNVAVASIAAVMAVAGAAALVSRKRK